MVSLWATSDIITAAKLNKSFNNGLDANKGTPSVIGESYLATDTNLLYYSLNGTSWGYIIETTAREVKGESTITAESTSVVVTHNLGTVPSFVAKTPLDENGLDSYIDTITSTQMTINLQAPIPANAVFKWLVKK